MRGQIKGTCGAGRARPCVWLFAPGASHLPWCGQCGSAQSSESPVLPSEAAPASALTLLLSRLSCVLALGFGVSISASVSVPVSLLLAATGSS